MLNGICVAVVAAGLSAGWFESDPYEEERELRVEATGVETLVVEAGAGSLRVRGVEGLKAVELLATVQVQEGEEEAKETIREHLVLSLKRSGSSAKLVSRFAGERSVNGGIKLEVRVPSGTGLDIDDGSGSIVVRDTRAPVRIKDTSGSITLDSVGTVDIQDREGSVTVAEASGNVRIQDGSGSIRVSGVRGSVTIDDGSGSIRVHDVTQDLVVLDDGSGSLRFTNIGGDVVRRD